MTPQLRAIADRLIFDIACLKHAVTQLPEGALDMRPGDGDWTVRQVLAHLGAYHELYAGMLDRLAAGEEPWPANLRQEGFQESTVEAEDSRLPALLARIATQRDRTIARFPDITPVQLEATTGRGKLLDRLHDWAMHYATHGVEIVAAFPSLHLDAVLLNWALLYEFLERDTSAIAAQGRLVESVRQLTRED